MSSVSTKMILIRCDFSRIMQLNSKVGPRQSSVNFHMLIKTKLQGYKDQGLQNTEFLLKHANNQLTKSFEKRWGIKLWIPIDGKTLLHKS